MAESNQDGRNQKLVIDYLEALLSDSDNEDSIISVESEILNTAPPLNKGSAEFNADPVDEVIRNNEAEELDISSDAASDVEVSDNESIEAKDDQLEDVQVVDVQEEWAEIEAEQAEEFLANNLTGEIDATEALVLEGSEQNIEQEINTASDSVEAESLEEAAQEHATEESALLEEADDAQLEVVSQDEEIEPAEEAVLDAQDANEPEMPEVELIEADLAIEDEENKSEISEMEPAQETQGIEEQLDESDTNELNSDANQLHSASEESPEQGIAEKTQEDGVAVSMETEQREDQVFSESEHAAAQEDQNAAMIEQEAEAQMQSGESLSDEGLSDEGLSSEVEAEKPVELSINCIIILMYGLKLAIPFEQFEGHIKLSNVTLSLDNDRDWILGDFTSSTMRTHVVDTAQILFGDNYDALNSNYNEMLVLEGKHWSIVFDKVIKTQNILLSDVTENPSPQFRPWLTGTYMPEKCALVNVSAMVKMFEDELNGASN